MNDFYGGEISMLTLARILIGSIVGLSCVLTPPQSVRAQTTQFCAKPWATLTIEEKKKLDEITSTIIDQPGLVKTPKQLWDTRTIPYYVDSGLSPDLIAKIKKAAKILAERTLIRFVK